MSTSSIMWMAACIVGILALGHSASAAEAWRVAEQPDLKQALENAPVLHLESLGQPARGSSTWEHWPVPNPDGKSWDLLQWYMEYGPMGRQEVYIVDLSTGQVKRDRTIPPEHSIYIIGKALAFDGKYYLTTHNRGPGLGLYVYDPATNSIESRGLIMPKLGGEVISLAVGPDERLYGAASGDQGKVGLYCYDPKLQKVVRDYGLIGPSHPNGAWSGYTMAVDDTHAYVVSGMIPWYLLSVDLKTGEDKVLLESPTERRIEVIQKFPGAWASVPQADGAPPKEYWLYHGQMTPKVDDNPPWPPQASPWDKAAATKPEFYYEQIDPDAQGNATLWYRLPEDAAKAPKNPPADVKAEDLDWRSLRLEEVESYAGRIGPLALLPDGRLYGGAEHYMGSFLFDPKTDQATPLGRNQGLAAYTHIVSGGKLYSTGYPGGPIWVYDATRPWTAHKGGPPGHPAPDGKEPASNPRYVASRSLESVTRVAIAHSSARGADGKLYFGGFGERHYEGGGFGWLDPKTEQIGGLWEPLSGYAVFYLAPVQGGRLIAISTRPAPDERNEHRVPEEAKLFFYDVQQGKIVKDLVPIKGARTTGLITEVAPGRLLGLTTDTVDPEHPGNARLYGLDVVTGKVLFTKALPLPLSVDDWWPHWIDPSYEYLDLVHGPDGFIWTYLKDVLVRIDPKDASVYVVGKVDSPGHPTFVGNDLYFSGAKELRRLRHIVPQEKRSSP